MADTYARSLAHWSEAKRQGMDDFYALATADYRHLAEALDWKAWLEARQAAVGDRALRVLDVACGSGKFPTALRQHAGVEAATLRQVDYALLDPSPFSIAEAKAALGPPFVPGAEFETTLQALECPKGAFDIVWATHALYAVPMGEIQSALARFLHATGGVGFIAHAAADAHYTAFYRKFLGDFRGGAGEPYTTAEDIVAGLEGLGVVPEIREIRYANGTFDTARAQVEGFLQRCVFDDNVTLDALMAGPHTGPYLEQCLRDGAWRFEQHVKLIFIDHCGPS